MTFLAVALLLFKACLSRTGFEMENIKEGLVEEGYVPADYEIFSWLPCVREKSVVVSVISVFSVLLRRYVAVCTRTGTYQYEYRTPPGRKAGKNTHTGNMCVYEYNLM